MSKPVRARRVPPYFGEPYWERETPREVRTGNLVLRYYWEAGKLQVSVRCRNYLTGDEWRGTTVTLDQDDFQENPEALRFLLDVLRAWEESR